jgi:hypothetical protein
VGLHGPGLARPWHDEATDTLGIREPWLGWPRQGSPPPSLNTSDLTLYSPSAFLEPGFYVRAGLEVGRGAIVTIPVGAVDLAYVEDGLVKASGDRFLKRVAAIEGDRVCSGNGRIT